MGMTKGEEIQKGLEELFEGGMAENFPDTDQASSESTNHDKQQKHTCRHIIFKLQKTKEEEKIMKETGERKYPINTRTRTRIPIDFL